MTTIQYYRIVNADKKDKNDVQYLDGVNVWKGGYTQKSYWSEESMNGFIFHETKDILQYVNTGSHVLEIFLPVTDPDFKLIKNETTNNFQATKIIVGKSYDLSNIDTFKMLVTQGASIHACNNLPLEWACSNEYLDIAAFIIEQTDDTQIDYEKLLKSASEYGRLNVVKFLIDHGAKIDTIGDKMLQESIRHGHTEIVKYLVENGVSVHGDSRLDNGLNDPIKTACYRGRYDIVKYLWEHGADIKNDCDPLRYACSDGHLETVKFLIEKGSRVYDKNYTSFYGKHVLEWAKHQPKVFEYLCEHLAFTHD